MHVGKKVSSGPCSGLCAACGGLDVPTSAVRGVVLKVAVAEEGRLWRATLGRLRAASNTEERDQLIVALAGHQEKARRFSGHEVEWAMRGVDV